MKSYMDKACCTIWLLVLLCIAFSDASDGSDYKEYSQSERSGRSWHSALFGGGHQQQTLINQQNPSMVPTSQPGEPTSIQPDPTGSNRNFEDHDKSAMPSEPDYMSRHFGYLNVHRFDPNFPYYDRQFYPRFPSPQVSGHHRFGPGYRKDKYGHGYGYSCKQGDDCDEVRAANQITAARHPIPPPFNTHYPDLPPFPSIPSFSSIHSSLGPPFYSGGGQQQPNPSRFNDPHLVPNHLIPSMGPPSRFYHARYLHDEDKSKSPSQDVLQNDPEENPKSTE